jgi:hypothetical protein
VHHTGGEPVHAAQSVILAAGILLALVVVIVRWRRDHE